MRWERGLRLSMLGAGVALACLAVPAGAQQAAPAGYADEQAGDEYSFIDRADMLWDAIGDAPPDFAFGFEDGEPWAWRTNDGYTIVVEDAGAEGIRSYYFAPGEDGPFLIVEPGRSFGFDAGVLAVVYGPDGGVLPAGRTEDSRDEAEDLFARALALRQAMAGSPPELVDADAWIDASPYIFGFIQIWDEGRSRYPGWGRYHARHRESAWRWRLEEERRRRRGLADAFARWRHGGFQGRPPGRYHWNKDGRGDGRPGHRPQPGAGGPPRPSQPGTGRPPRPDRPGRPIHRPAPQPPGGTGAGNPPTPPGAAPVPGGRPNWGRPGWGRPNGDRPDRPGRPPRPRPGGESPTGGTPAPAPTATPTPVSPPAPGTRPPRPEGGWQRPERPGRPGGGWQRPPRSGGDMPTSSPTPAPVPAPATRPPRPEGGWQRPPRPEGGWQRPPQPRPPATVPAAPAAAPVTRPGWGGGRPAPAPRSYAPPPQRPAAAPSSPPAPRYNPPANPPSRPAPPPRPPRVPKIDTGDGARVD